MDKKLRQWGISAEDRQTVIDYLVTNHYVDDSRYTEAFVEDKIRFNQWGRRKIEQALYAKGVSADVYTPVLDRVPDSAYLEQLRPLLKAKWPTIKADSDYERSMKPHQVWYGTRLFARPHPTVHRQRERRRSRRR